MSFSLTPQQIRFFQVFGFLKFPQLLGDRIATITEEFEAIWAGHGGGHNGKPHDGTARSCVVPFIDQREYLCSLLDDPRILAIGRDLLGNDFNYFSSDGNYYVGDSRWHSDMVTTEVKFVKIALYLDPLTATTGALRVIPGSHHMNRDAFADGVQGEIWHSEDNWGVPGKDLPCVVLDVVPGDVLCFDQNLKHASFGGGQWRRMFTINLSQRYLDERIGDLRDHVAHFSRYWLDHVYGATMVRTASPDRRRHLAGC